MFGLGTHLLSYQCYFSLLERIPNIHQTMVKMQAMYARNTVGAERCMRNLDLS